MLQNLDYGLDRGLDSGLKLSAMKINFLFKITISNAQKLMSHNNIMENV